MDSGPATWISIPIDKSSTEHRLTTARASVRAIAGAGDLIGGTNRRLASIQGGTSLIGENYYPGDSGPNTHEVSDGQLPGRPVLGPEASSASNLDLP